MGCSEGLVAQRHHLTIAFCLFEPLHGSAGCVPLEHDRLGLFLMLASIIVEPVAALHQRILQFPYARDCSRVFGAFNALESVDEGHAAILRTSPPPLPMRRMVRG